MNNENMADAIRAQSLGRITIDLHGPMHAYEIARVISSRLGLHDPSCIQLRDGTGRYVFDVNRGLIWYEVVDWRYDWQRHLMSYFDRSSGFLANATYRLLTAIQAVLPAYWKVNEFLSFVMEILAFFLRSVGRNGITYDDAVDMRLLGVFEDLIEAFAALPPLGGELSSRAFAHVVYANIPESTLSAAFQYLNLPRDFVPLNDPLQFHNCICAYSYARRFFVYRHMVNERVIRQEIAIHHRMRGPECVLLLSGQNRVERGTFLDTQADGLIIEYRLVPQAVQRALGSDTATPQSMDVLENSDDSSLSSGVEISEVASLNPSWANTVPIGHVTYHGAIRVARGSGRPSIFDDAEVLSSGPSFLTRSESEDKSSSESQTYAHSLPSSRSSSLRRSINELTRRRSSSSAQGEDSSYPSSLSSSSNDSRRPSFAEAVSAAVSRVSRLGRAASRASGLIRRRRRRPQDYSSTVLPPMPSIAEYPLPEAIPMPDFADEVIDEFLRQLGPEEVRSI